MAKHGKKYRAMKDKQLNQAAAMLSVKEAVAQVKKLAYAKFDETVDIDVNLGIDASKGEQVVRGSVVLPHGVGKKVRVVVFAKGEYAEEAEKAGADYVGLDDLVEKINGGWMDFEYAVATPDVMGIVGKVAKALGPRGLLPNKKVGTVTFEVKAIVTELKKGRRFFRNDKNGLVHFSFGKVSFDAQQLEENLRTFVKALSAAKPSASKGVFLQKMTVSSTMGPGVAVDTGDALRA